MPTTHPVRCRHITRIHCLYGRSPLCSSPTRQLRQRQLIRKLGIGWLSIHQRAGGAPRIELMYVSPLIFSLSTLPLSHQQAPKVQKVKMINFQLIYVK